MCKFHDDNLGKDLTLSLASNEDAFVSTRNDRINASLKNKKEKILCFENKKLSNGSPIDNNNDKFLPIVKSLFFFSFIIIYYLPGKTKCPRFCYYNNSTPLFSTSSTSSSIFHLPFKNPLQTSLIYPSSIIHRPDK